MSPKRVIKVAAAITLLTGLVLGVWSILIEPNRLVLHSETILLPNWPSQLNNLKVIMIGDLHAGSPFIDSNKINEIVRLANDQQPDLIVLMGDYVVPDKFYQKPMLPERIVFDLRALHAPLGVFAVLGNHDWRDRKRITQSFEAVGIRVLENEVVELRQNDQSLWLLGFADAWTGPQDISGVAGRLPEGATAIGLTHNPDIFPQLPTSVPLLLAAHTHGGQVNLPLVGRLIVPSSNGQKYAAGHIEENGKHLFVTTGIGTSILPLRFRVPPEVVVLTISRN